MKKIAVLLAILFVAPMVFFSHDSNLALSEKYNSGTLAEHFFDKYL